MLAAAGCALVLAPSGSGALRSPSAEVVPATHTHHDVLLVRAHLTAQR